MGTSNSRLEEDKSLQLCRARKKFIKQALNGRCSLAAAHIAYIEELKIIGAALRRFVERDAQVEPFVYPLRILDPEPQHVDSMANTLPNPSLEVSSRYESHAMKFRGTFSTKIEEKPSVPVVVSVTSTIPPSIMPPAGSTKVPSFENSHVPSDAPPWDYFGLFHPMDQEQRRFDQGSESSDEIQGLRDEEGIPELEDVEEVISSPQESEDEFEEPSSASLVRRFRNVNPATENVVNGDSPVVLSQNANEVKDNSSQSIISETKLANGKKDSTPDLSPRRDASKELVHLNDVKITTNKESKIDENVARKDFFSSIKDIERLFVKASESGEEVPRMLEANKFHFHPILHGKERGSITLSLLKSCFSCGKDPTEVQQEPSQSSYKYLTWHRTVASHPSTPRSLLVANSTDSVDNLNNNLFDNSCMVSGSHASTLDRLHAWEKKLYDEVKAGELRRSNFDWKCKLLRQKESRGKNADKTRAAAKDLHSRIRVAIHRIDSISKKIEEIRDVELQPQLEELIEGLRKMWEAMLECHKLQFQIVSSSHNPQTRNIKINLDSQRQITIHLGHELSSLSSTFTKWIYMQKIYVESINKWLFKCISIPQKPSKRNKRMRLPPLRNYGPPIYMMCGAWLEMINELPSKGVMDSIRELAAEVAHFLPRQEKNEGKLGNLTHKRDHVLEDSVLVLDRFRTSLTGFLGKLNNYAECSLRMFVKLQKAIQEAKSNYEQFKSQQSQVRV